MEVDEDPTRQYIKARPTYSHFSEEVAKLLRALLSEHQIEFHTIENRAKSVESFSEKISRPGKNYGNPFLDIQDLSGVRVILYSLADVDRALKVIDQEFQVDVENSQNKADNLAVDQFGYLSVHKVVAIGNGRESNTEWRKFSKLVCEIQVRTVLQHAWASISHKLQYKHETDIPAVFRRKLTRLAGLLELADEEFQSVGEGIVERNIKLAEQGTSIDAVLQLDLDSLFYFFKTSNMWVEKYSDAVRATRLQISSDVNNSELLSICKSIKLDTIQEFEKLLAQLHPKALKFYEKFDKANEGLNVTGDIAHWIGVLLVGFDNGSKVDRSLLKWGEDYFKDAIIAGRGVF